jgi:WD40 repeat protein
MDGSIFISYRRGDGPGFAGRLYDRLEQEFSPERVFLDVDNIAPGLDFVEVLSSKVAACDVLLAVIGRNWAEARDGNGDLRLHNPDDFVRIEIEQALALKKRVIPVLVDGADMPQRKAVPPSLQPLLRRNAVRLTHEGFRSDVERLVAALEEAMADIRKGPKPPAKSGEETKQPAQPPSPETQKAAGASFDSPSEETSGAKRPPADDTSKRALPIDASAKKTGARSQKKGAVAAAGADAEPEASAEAPRKTHEEVQAWLKEQQEKDEKFKLKRLKAAEEKAARGENKTPLPPPIVTGRGDTGTRPPEPERVSPTPPIAEPPVRPGISRRVVLGGAAIGVAAAAWFTRDNWLPGGGEVLTINEPVRVVSDRLMIADADFDPFGQSFVTGTAGGNVGVWSLAGGRDIKLDGHKDSVTSTVFSPVRDGGRLLTLSMDGKALIRSGERYQDTMPLQGNNPTICADWNRNGTHVAISGSEATLWDARSGKLVRTIEGHRGAVTDLAFASWGDVLATASLDGTAQLWDATGSGHLATLNADAGPVFAVVISPIDGHIVTLSKGAFIVWSWTQIGPLTSTRLDTTKRILTADFSPDGSQIVTAAVEGTADIWSVKGEHIGALEGHEGALTGAWFAPGGALILTTSRDKTARLWNRETRETVAILTGHTGAVTAAKFSRDGTYALTLSDDLSARVWGIPSDLVLI